MLGKLALYEDIISIMLGFSVVAAVSGVSSSWGGCVRNLRIHFFNPFDVAAELTLVPKSATLAPLQRKRMNKTRRIYIYIYIYIYYVCACVRADWNQFTWLIFIRCIHTFIQIYIHTYIHYICIHTYIRIYIYIYIYVYTYVCMFVESTSFCEEGRDVLLLKRFRPHLDRFSW